MTSTTARDHLIIPTADQIISAHDANIFRHGGSMGLRDPGLLEGAIGRARNAVDIAGVDALEAAAILCHGIIKSHAFIDGNKRAAYSALVLTLAMNDMMQCWSGEQFSKTIISTAGGSQDYRELLQALRVPGIVRADPVCRLLSEHDAEGEEPSCENSLN